MDKVFLSLNEQNTKLNKVFKSIESKTGFTFFYDQQLVNVSQTVTLDKANSSLTEVLYTLSSMTGLRFLQINKVINVKNAEIQTLRQTSSSDVTVKGRVTSELEADGIPGVNVQIKGTTIGTVTELDGSFEIKVPDGNAVLVFSYIGYERQEVQVGNRSRVDIMLKEDARSMEEVVVVGYGTQKKIHLTGAVSQISSEMLENRPVANIGQALQGAIPNLNVGIANGSPNTVPSFNVRGGTSFSGNNFQSGSPLILVDGIEMDINQLNPEDIESVSVLKDAASAAVYGSRAAFGVMLVTTKRGKKDQPVRINYTTSYQWNSPSTRPDLLDALTIQEASIKALELENRTPSSDMLERRDRIAAHMADPENVPPYFMENGNIQWIGNTRVYDEAVRNSSPMMKHNINMRGGSGKNNYYLSMGYQSQEGLFKINTDTHDRYNLMANVNSQVNDWFSLESRISYNNTTFNEPVNPAGKGGLWRAMAQEPGRNINMPIRTSPDDPAPNMYTDNILSFMDYGSNNRENRETSLFALAPKFNLAKNWVLQGNFSYKSMNFRRKQVVPELRRVENRWDQTTNVHTNPSYVQRWNQHSDQFAVNIFSDYSFDLNQHEFYLMGGFNQEWYSFEYLGGRGEGILTPFIPVIQQTLGNLYAYDSESEWALRGGFYRVSYNYGSKYLLESNGRYDATSRFSRGTRYKFYPSVSGGWRVTEEDFAAGIRPYINEFKIRGSYGSLGNQNVSNYPYIATYGTTQEVQHLFGGARPLGINPPGLVDAMLTWETAETLDIGFDLTLMDKLDFTFSWYKRTTSDILTAGEKLPAVLGTGVPTRNSGSLETKGFELTAKWRDELKNGLSYDVAFNLSDYTTTVTKFDGNPNNILSALYPGMMMGEIWGYETLGIFQTQEQIDNAPTQNLLSPLWFPGDVQYKDLNGDGEITPGANTLEDSGDRSIIGNSTPRFQFGLNMNASFKNFDLNIFFQGVGKRDFYIGDNMYWGGMAGGTGTYEVYNNTWTPDRPDAFFPAYKNKGANRLTQTRFLHNAAYVRLKNLSVGYNLPRELCQSFKLERLRVYGAAHNLWEFTKVPTLFDPEVMSANYPMIRSLALGLQVTF
ncbi:TonB-dependent receptor [Belliella marina]|uniref:TonB-dependent receptor n=1 Tax=Belliella marina TaxID=1644146 RepID=A0ABW4VPM0_9BACT